MHIISTSMDLIAFYCDYTIDIACMHTIPKILANVCSSCTVSRPSLGAVEHNMSRYPQNILLACFFLSLPAQKEGLSCCYQQQEILAGNNRNSQTLTIHIAIAELENTREFWEQ